MYQVKLALAISIALLLGGCATSRSDVTATPAGQNAPRIATPVIIPAASARNVVMAMTGPREVVEAKDWANFKREWRETFADHAKAQGITFSLVESEPQPQGHDGTLLLVNVADYRMVGIGARIWLGIMTGNAYINAKIKFSNLRDGTPFGEQEYNTTSSAAGGVFAKVTPQQVNTIATEVFTDLKAAR
ncbi:MAG: hypothetical protein ACKVQA_08935 [Burkholderiales bacterium]